MIDLKIGVIDSNKSLQDLAPQWNALLDQSCSGTIFLTCEWISAWADAFLRKNRRLFVLTFQEKEQLVGIAPLYIEHRRHGPFSLREIRFLGAPEAGSDYLDVFALRGREKAVANALYDFLMGEAVNSWDQLVLQDISADALFLFHFMNRIQAEGKYAEIARSSYCPIANLEGAEGEFSPGVSLRRRKRFKQELGIILRDSRVEHLVEKGENGARLEQFFCLYEEKGGWSAKDVRLILQGLVGRCNGHSPVQLDLLSVKGQTVAGLLHLTYRKTLALYLMAVDKEFNPKISIGNLLVGLSIKNAIAEGHSAYDFLKGNESYKFHWATGGKSTMQVLFWQKRPVAMTSAVSRLSRHAGKLILR